MNNGYKDDEYGLYAVFMPPIAVSWSTTMLPRFSGHVLEGTHKDCFAYAKKHYHNFDARFYGYLKKLDVVKVPHADTAAADCKNHAALPARQAG